MDLILRLFSEHVCSFATTSLRPLLPLMHFFYILFLSISLFWTTKTLFAFKERGKTAKNADIK